MDRDNTVLAAIAGLVVDDGMYNFKLSQPHFISKKKNFQTLCSIMTH